MIFQISCKVVLARSYTKFLQLLESKIAQGNFNENIPGVSELKVHDT